MSTMCLGLKTELMTPEQIEAIKYAEENIYPIEILVEVAASITKTVPNGSDKPGWGYGSCRVTYTIGGLSAWDFEQGTAPKDVNLSDIKYFGFYRQAVKNKHTGELKGFCSVVGGKFAGEVDYGQTIDLKDGQAIRPGWNREDVEEEARRAFLKLQEICEEFYDKETVWV